MDEGRLGIVRRQENSRRKFVFMLNEVMRSQCNVVDECISREKFEIGVKYDKSFVPIRRAVVKQRVLQQCLKMKRDPKIIKNRNLGVYGGKPLYTFSRDIDKFIADMHPRLRRLKQAEKALTESIEKGKILDPKKVPLKIEQYFKKNWKNDIEEKVQKPKPAVLQESKDIFKNTRNMLPPIRGILNPYSKRIWKDYADKNDNDRTDESSKHLVEEDRIKSKEHQIQSDSKHQVAINTNRLSEQTNNTIDVPDNSVLREKTKGLLILPPIQQTKQMVQR
ncbi:uncharacterized protein LOC134708337 [Mytilus trossulus]|uniref:uncharacterized protein LOC134708337 n=1 Tax=Mytilus trossulus TaxID=6551 RepID=UPI003006E52C